MLYIHCLCTHGNPYSIMECLQKHDMFIMLKLILSHAPEAQVLECEVFEVYTTKQSVRTCSDGVVIENW